MWQFQSAQFGTNLSFLSQWRKPILVIALRDIPEMDRRELLYELFGSREFAEEVENSRLT